MQLPGLPRHAGGPCEGSFAGSMRATIAAPAFCSDRYGML